MASMTGALLAVCLIQATEDVGEEHTFKSDEGGYVVFASDWRTCYRVDSDGTILWAHSSRWAPVRVEVRR